MKTTNGKRGGNLVGKPHNDTSGNPVGGIKAQVTDAGGKPVELEGGEVIINKEASKKYWKELSKINQSAGNGVPIEKPIDPHDEDPSEYKEGGKIIEFNRNHVPNSWILTYAKSIKKDHPEIWKLGGNIYGNTAFENLCRVSARGYWLDSEEWMYIKWRSYVARHRHDFRIEGVVAMLKWVDKVDKGWRYMKDLIEAKIKKGSAKPKSMKTGGELIKRADGSYSQRGLWDNIRDNAGSGKKPTKQMLEQEAKIKAETMRDGGSVGFENTLFDELAQHDSLSFKDGGEVKDNKSSIIAFNKMIEKEWLPMWKEEYDNDLGRINELVARHYLYAISQKHFKAVEEIEFVNRSKNPTNHFQMIMYIDQNILWTSPFIYVDNNHKIVLSKTKVQLLDANYETIKENIKFKDGGEVKDEFANTMKLIDEIKKHSFYTNGTISTAKDGQKYRYDKYKLKYPNAANWLVSLFEKAAKENTGKTYNTQFNYTDTYSFHYDRPNFKGMPNGKISMSELVLM